MVWLFGAETDKEANFGYSVPTLYIKSPRARCRTMTATTAETIFVPIVAVYRERAHSAKMTPSIGKK